MRIHSRQEALKALGLKENSDRTVSDEEIKGAYKKLAKEFHPDVNSEPEAFGVYLYVREAYDYLCLHKTEEVGIEQAPKNTAGEPMGCATGAQRTAGVKIFGAKDDLTELKYRRKAREDHARQEQRSRLREEEKKVSFDEKMEQYKKDRIYNEVMTKIHQERAAELAARMIEAYLKGELK